MMLASIANVTTFAQEWYLNKCQNKKHRHYFAKLRMSAYRLEIETARYSKKRLPPSLRICKMCTNSVCEDEPHFLLKCSKYEQLRKEMFSKIQEHYPNFSSICDKDKFIWLMSSADKIVIQAVAAYTFNSFEIRGNTNPS